MNIEANMEDILLRTMPSAAKLIRENSLNINEIIGTGKEGRITKGDVLLYLKDKNLIVENNLNRQEKKISTDRKDNIMDIIVPTLGESIVEATVSKWLRKEGDYVEIDEPIVELETDKVTLEVPASMEGLIEKIDISEGETVEVGQVLGSIKKADKKPSPVEKKETQTKEISEKTPNEIKEVSIVNTNVSNKNNVNFKEEERVPMSRLRKAIAKRLKDAQNNAAMLTTYNEVDMTEVMKIRTNFQPMFEKKHSVKLGFMSFFVKAVIESLREFPAVNAEINNDEIVYKNYYNIGVAVGTTEGLVVPVLKNAENMSFPEIEKNIVNFGSKARDGSLTISDMSDGTFTISNGGIYGSLMSSPILNPPQSGILGMHKIQKRPVAIGDNIELRPMMYLALSYDHRIIDGREAVSFLVRVKENIENPQRILIGV
jgi:2-oxoglutarate dehydrogenase E2 component (dihydrolipoamide succinyltransferase)|tara:strand:- start:60 stop:1346 length:1287 start_codon:yes stop_codon:yes gene_type:complete